MNHNRFILTPYYLDEILPGLQTLAGKDWKINKPELPIGNNQERMGILYCALAELVAETISQGELPVSIAGDCCAAIAVLAGMQRVNLDPLLIWFDAHGDFNTWETTPSGFLGGMPLAMLVGRGEQTLVEAVSLHPLPEAQVVLADGRNLDPGERRALENSRVHHLTDVKDLLEYPLPDKPIYFHFDVDVITSLEAPAMNYPDSGGPTAAELANVFRHLAGSRRIAAVSMSSWNPALDKSGQSKEVCLELLQLLVN